MRKTTPTTPATNTPSEAITPPTDGAQAGEAPSLQPLAVDEATMAGLIGVSPEHLGNLTREGLVPAVKLGRRTLYSVRAMDEVLFKRAMLNVKAADPAPGGNA